MHDDPPSWYAATANARGDHPALAGAVSADVVVIGGGYTGLAAALSAAEVGYSVILLEAHRVGWGASGRNGGQMIPGLRWSAVDLVDAFGDNDSRQLLRTALAARERVEARIERHAIACDLRRGHFTAASKPSHLDSMRREADCLARLIDDHMAQIIPAAHIDAIVTSPIYHGGLFDPSGGHLHPLNYALGLADAAAKAGVQIYEQTPALNIETRAPIGVRTPAGLVNATYAILACDAFMASIDRRLARFTMPVANYNIATEPLGPERARALIPSGAAVADSRFVLNYFRLSADHRLIFGGGEKYTPRPPADVAAFVRPFMEQVFPQLHGIGIDYTWSGLVGVTRNRLPHFGRRGNCFFAHGYSGHGVLLTTLAGELIVEAMRGTAERFDLFANLPHKPFPGGPLLRHPLYVAGMLWYALRDRL